MLSMRLGFLSAAVGFVGLNAAVLVTHREVLMMTPTQAPEFHGVADKLAYKATTNNNYKSNHSSDLASKKWSDVSSARSLQSETRDCQSRNETLDQIQVPTFILAGAQKAGTTALFQILSMHPGIESSRRFETHFFNTQVGTGAAGTASQEQICALRQNYMQEFNLEPLLQQSSDNAPAIVTFEKSPVYLCKPYIPAYIKRVVPWTKVLLILRNPRDRAYSQWRFDRDESSKGVKAFDSVITEEIKSLHKLRFSTAPSLEEYLQDSNKGNNSRFDLPSKQTVYKRSCRDCIDVNSRKDRKKLNSMCGYLSRGMYAQQLVNWLETFELGVNLKVVRYEQFLKNQKAVMHEILHFIGAEDDKNSSDFQLDNKILQHDFSPGKSRSKRKSDMNPKVRNYLSRFYRPYNDELADLLGDEWRNVWT